MAEHTAGEAGNGPNLRGLQRAGLESSQLAADDVDLRDSLGGLVRLAAASMPLADLLGQVASYAVRAIPGADGAGVTLYQDKRPNTLVASAPFVEAVDAVQYSLGQGPCITAAAERRTVRSGSLDEEPAWPAFGKRAVGLGVHSALSLPLIAPDAVLGALNVYAHARDTFDDRAAEIGELFAVPAAFSMHNAQALFQARNLAAQLQAALTHRQVIDQALGIIMSRSGCSPDEAFAKLRAISQSENRKLPAVAGSLLDEAVRRARARHTSSS